MKKKRGVVSGRRAFETAILTISLSVSMLTGCSGQEESLKLTEESKGATNITKEINKSVYDKLDFDDTAEVENAGKGLITAPEELEITNEDGKVIWSQKAYSFLEEDAVDTSNPSLWRNAQLNHIYGLFEVMNGIYQVRGYDMANITFIKSDNGWIVFDPLMSVECSTAAKQLVFEQLGEGPIKAVVISHSHVDHYGGIKGIVSEEEVEENNIPIIVQKAMKRK